MSDTFFSESSFYQQLFNQISLGLLVYQPAETDASSGYRLIKSNATARYLLTGQLTDPADETTAIPDFWLFFMDQVQQTGQSQQFEWVTTAPTETGLRRIPVVVQRMDAFLVVTLSEPVLSTQVPPSLAGLTHQERLLLLDTFDQTPNAVVVFRPVHDEAGQIVDFLYVAANQATHTLTRRPLTELMGHRLLALFPHLQPTGVFDRFVQSMQTGQSVQFEQRYQEDGLDGWYKITAARKKDVLLVFAVDSTATRQMVTEKQDQTSFLQQLIDISPSGITVYEAIRDSAGTITDFRTMLYNRATLDIMVQSPVDIEQLFHTRFPEDTNPGLFDFYVHLTNQKESNRTIRFYPLINKWLDVAAIQMGDGFMVMFNDATTAQRSTQQLEEQARQRQSILDAAINGIMLLEAVHDDAGQIIDFVVLSVNRASEGILKRPVHPMLGQRLLACFPGFREAGFFDAYVAVTETGTPQRLESRYRDNELDAWLEVSVVQQDAGVVITFVDVTQAKADREKVDALVKELQRSNESLEQFAYIASHDLQEPLRKLQAFGDIMQNQFADSLSEGEVDMVRRIQGSARRMQDLIRDLLAYSRLATQTEPNEPVNLATVTSEVISDLEIIIKEKNALIEVGPLPMVQGNAFRLRQLVQNLLSNGLKFQPGDLDHIPEIRMSCRPAEPDELPDELQGSSQKAYVLLQVADNGIGFDEKYKERIFHPFQRLHNRLTYSGTGIGLAICKKVVESQGGAIDVSSEIGVGTTFRVFLLAND